jgi:endoglucanase
VIISEWGAVNKNNTADRETHARAYAEMVTERGMCPVWWDNGWPEAGPDGFALLDRRASPPSWVFPEIVTALVEGATAGSASAN